MGQSPECRCDLTVGATKCDNCGCEMDLSRFHIRTHVAGFTLKDRPLYSHTCPQFGEIRTVDPQPWANLVCRCNVVLGTESICDNDLCEHHSITHYSVLITDADGQEMGVLAEFGTDRHAATNKAESLNLLAADPETRFKVGEKKGRKQQIGKVQYQFGQAESRLYRGSMRYKSGGGIDWGKLDNSAGAELPIKDFV